MVVVPFAMPQYRGGKSKPAKAHVWTFYSPNVCHTEFVVLRDTRYIETETNILSDCSGQAVQH